MEISLKKCEVKDCIQVHEMQVRAFSTLLDKYRDYETNPGAEALERIQKRMAQSFTDYYFICLGKAAIGVLRIVKLDNNVCRISPMFILPEFQGNGYAQLAILQVESLYPHARRWELDTIKQEAGLRYLYEKMGYRPTGKEELLREGMTIIFYEKSP